MFFNEVQDYYNTENSIYDDNFNVDNETPNTSPSSGLQNMNPNMNNPNNNSLEQFLGKKRAILSTSLEPNLSKNGRKKKGSGEGKHNRFGADNMQRKVKVALQASCLSFLNLLMSKLEKEKDELLIRKMSKEQTTNVTKKCTKNKNNNEGNHFSMTNQLNQTILEYFSQDISTKYRKLDKNQNKKNFTIFFERCQDEKIKNLLNTLTLLEFYEKVFIGGENILGLEQSDFEQIKTFNKYIKEKIDCNKKDGFEDEKYVEDFIDYAQNCFTKHYLKKSNEKSNYYSDN